eukprot:scaffold44534_cov267-Amphora_coffeaeformis.AAC.1
MMMKNTVPFLKRPDKSSGKGMGMMKKSSKSNMGMKSNGKSSGGKGMGMMKPSNKSYRMKAIPKPTLQPTAMPTTSPSNISTNITQEEEPLEVPTASPNNMTTNITQEEEPLEEPTASPSIGSNNMTNIFAPLYEEEEQGEPLQNYYIRSQNVMMKMTNQAATFLSPPSPILPTMAKGVSRGVSNNGYSSSSSRRSMKSMMGGSSSMGNMSNKSGMKSMMSSSSSISKMSKKKKTGKINPGFTGPPIVIMADFSRASPTNLISLYNAKPAGRGVRVNVRQPLTFPSRLVISSEKDIRIGEPCPRNAYPFYSGSTIITKSSVVAVCHARTNEVTGVLYQTFFTDPALSGQDVTSIAIDTAESTLRDPLESFITFGPVTPLAEPFVLILGGTDLSFVRRPLGNGVPPSIGDSCPLDEPGVNVLKPDDRFPFTTYVVDDTED